MANHQVKGVLQNFSPQQLLERCRQRKEDNSHESYCFELFRRAIVEKNEQCWSAIYQQYHQLIYRWIKNYINNQPAYQHISIDEEVQNVFMNFWRAYSAEKLDKAKGLASVLQYLKACAGTTILQEIRKLKKRKNQPALVVASDDSEAALVASDDSPDQALFQQLEAAQVWEIVDGICHDEKDRIVARLSLVSNLKPRFILDKYPDLFTDIKELYTRRQNLKERLARDTELYAIWETSL
ncbi:hypothetical protein KFU94_64005 [Chloroflexi bacterium TSY]|nr:hypothetical protein [Chloroflexi bacterium TSY]